MPALTYIGDSLIIVRDGGLTVCRGTDKLKQTVDVDFDEDAICPQCGKELFPELPEEGLDGEPEEE